MILNGRISTVSAWLDTLPIEVLNSQPYIVALQGNIAMVTGDTKLALNLFNQALEKMEFAEDGIRLINTLSMRSAAYRVLGKIDEARNDANAILISTEGNKSYKKLYGEALRVIGLCDFHQGKLYDALQNLESALDVMIALNYQKSIAMIKVEIGLVQENLGNYVGSKSNYQEAINYWKKIENPFWISNILNNLGVLYQMTGDYKEASFSYDQAIKYARACGYSRMEAYILTGIGDIYSEINSDEHATQAYLMAEEIADRTQELFLQIYIRIQKAALFAFRRDFGKAYKMLDLARDLLKSGPSDMERNLIELEFSGIKIQENCASEVLPSLEKICEFFESGGHKTQFEKAHFYLLLGYISTNQHEKVIENLLHLLSSIQGEYPPASLIALASRYKRKLSDYSPSYLQSEYQLFTQLIEEFTEKLASLRRDIRKTSTMVQFSEAAIKIRSFGRMEVSVQTHTITNSEWQTQAAKELFYLLLARPEGLTKEEIRDRKSVV